MRFRKKTPTLDGVVEFYWVDDGFFFLGYVCLTKKGWVSSPIPLLKLREDLKTHPTKEEAAWDLPKTN
jgi:hypothetical protein